MCLDSYTVFRNNKKSLQYTSRDTSKNPIQFMTLCNSKVVDFDGVKTSIMSDDFHGKDDVARSADALLAANNELFIVEFKNGDFDGLEISQKANNSIMLFNYVTSKQIDYTRKNISFVLVYNGETKKIKNMKSQDSIALHRARLAKNGLRLFGTDKLKNYSYKSVYMVEKNKFGDFLERLKMRGKV